MNLIALGKEVQGPRLGILQFENEKKIKKSNFYDLDFRMISTHIHAYIKGNSIPFNKRSIKNSIKEFTI